MRARCNIKGACDRKYYTNTVEEQEFRKQKKEIDLRDAIGVEYFGEKPCRGRTPAERDGLKCAEG